MPDSWIPASEHIDQAKVRIAVCEKIVVALEPLGVHTTFQVVNRNYLAFYRWYNGTWPLGYVLRATGLKRGGNLVNGI